MNVRLKPDEVRQAIREYLTARGIHVEQKNDIKFSYFKNGQTVEDGSIVTDIIDVVQPVKEGPYR